VVVGSGPNGLVAAAVLARAGWSVLVCESGSVAGGAVGSDPAAIPGVVHDWGSAFYGVLRLGPVWDGLGLGRRLRWAEAPVPVAAGLAPGSSALLHPDPEATAAGLAADGAAWLELVAEWNRFTGQLLRAALGPLPNAGLVAALARLGPRAGLRLAADLLAPVTAYAAARFGGPAARSLLLAHATHADVGIDAAGSTPAALLLTLAAQTVGMPVPVGGAARLAAGLVGAVEEAGGVVRTDAEVTRVVVRGGRVAGVRLADGQTLAVRRAVLADTPPLLLARDLVGEDALPPGWLAALGRTRYAATGFFRLDVDLRAPTPWADPALAAVGVVHLPGTEADVRLGQAQAASGGLPAVPALIVGQQDVADATRVPPGVATLWVECAAPTGGWSPARTAAMEDRVLRTLERYAPGLRDRVLATTVATPATLQARDRNLVGGDVGGGSASLDRQLLFRPAPGYPTYGTPVRGLWMCSAASHPGGGAHGIVGWNAARVALRSARLGRG